MQVIAEITMYPLSVEYDTEIRAFVDALGTYPALDITVGETATVIRGDYDLVMDVLRRELRKGLDRPGRVAYVLKVLNTR